MLKQIKGQQEPSHESAGKAAGVKLSLKSANQSDPRKKPSQAAFLKQQARENNEHLVGVLMNASNPNFFKSSEQVKDNYQVIREQQAGIVTLKAHPQGAGIRRKKVASTAVESKPQEQVNYRNDHNGLVFKNSTEVKPFEKGLGTSSKHHPHQASDAHNQAASHTTRQPTSLSHQNKDILGVGFLGRQQKMLYNGQLSQQHSLVKTSFLGMSPPHFGAKMGSIDVNSPPPVDHQNTDDDGAIDPSFMGQEGKMRLTNQPFLKASDKLYQQSVKLDQQIQFGIEKNRQLKAALQFSNLTNEQSAERLLSQMKMFEQRPINSRLQESEQTLQTLNQNFQERNKEMVQKTSSQHRHQNLIEGLNGYDKNTKQLIQQILSDPTNKRKHLKPQKKEKLRMASQNQRANLKSPQQIQINKYLSQQHSTMFCPANPDNQNVGQPESLDAAIQVADSRTDGGRFNGTKQDPHHLSRGTTNERKREGSTPANTGYMLKRKQQQLSIKEEGASRMFLKDESSVERGLAPPIYGNSQVSNELRVLKGNKSHNSTHRSPPNFRTEDKPQKFSSTLANKVNKSRKNSKYSEHYGNSANQTRVPWVDVKQESNSTQPSGNLVAMKEHSPAKWDSATQQKNPIQTNALRIFSRENNTETRITKSVKHTTFKKDTEGHLLQMSSYPAAQYGSQSGGGIVGSPTQIAELHRILSHKIDEQSLSNDITNGHTKMSLYQNLDSGDSFRGESNKRKREDLSNQKRPQALRSSIYANEDNRYKHEAKKELIAEAKGIISPQEAKDKKFLVSPAQNAYNSGSAQHATVVSQDEFLSHMYPELTFKNQKFTFSKASKGDQSSTQQQSQSYYLDLNTQQPKPLKKKKMLKAGKKHSEMDPMRLDPYLKNNRNGNPLLDNQFHSIRSSKDSIDRGAKTQKGREKRKFSQNNQSLVRPAVTEGPDIDIDSDRVVLITNINSHANARNDQAAATTKQNSLKKGKQLKSKTSPSKKKPTDPHALSKPLPDLALLQEGNSEPEEAKFSHLLKLTCNKVFKPKEDEEAAEFKTVDNHFKVSSDKLKVVSPGSKKKSAPPKTLKGSNKSQSTIPGSDASKSLFTSQQQQQHSKHQNLEVIKQAYRDQRAKVVTPLYKYVVIPGNNGQLIERLMRDTFRRFYWQTEHQALRNQQFYSTNLNFRKGAGLSAYQQGHSQYHGSNPSGSNYGGTVRVPSPLKVHFKWSPCSIKGDFAKLANHSAAPTATGHSGLHGKSLRNYQAHIQKSIRGSIHIGSFVRPKHLINHLEGHKELSRKDDLVSNLKTQLQHESENLFDYTPVSFHIVLPEGKHASLEQFFRKFLGLYDVLNINRNNVRRHIRASIGSSIQVRPSPGQSIDFDAKREGRNSAFNAGESPEQKQSHMMIERFHDINLKLVNIAMSKGPQFRAMLQRESSTKYVMPQCHFIGANYWILKTTNQNRGNGIHVFKTIKELNAILNEYLGPEIKQQAGHATQAQWGNTSAMRASAASALRDGKGSSSYLSGGAQTGMSDFKKSREDEGIPWLIKNSAGDKTSFSGPVSVPKNLQFIIQKYIERPLLIHKRKFDIRVWVLINQDMEVYFCKEGYLRLSAVEYQLDNCQNLYVHLTNNAIQKNAKEYGRFEDGNQMDFTQFQEYIDFKYPDRKISVRDDIVEDIKFVVAKTIDSVKKKLDPHKRNGCFELFGYDFMIDSDFTVWLIEVNTNPCLEESSSILRRLLPRMLDDAFRLTIDRDFLSPLNQQKNDVEQIIKTLKASQVGTHIYGKSGDMKSTRQRSEQIVNEAAQKVNLSNQMDSAEHLLRKIDHDLWAQSMSNYQLDGYSDNESLWQKIMDIRNGMNGQACKQRFNLKATERVMRASSCFYAPFEHTKKLFVSDYPSYKQFKDQQKNSVPQIHL